MTNIWNKIKSLVVGSKDLTMLGSGSIIATGISGLFWFYIASLIEVENYGQISYFVAIASLVGVVSTLGVQNAITVFTAKGEKIISQLAFLSIICGVISSAILFFIFYNLGVSLYVLGYIVSGIVSSEILGRKLYKTYSKYVISQRILMVVLSVGFYYLIGPNGVIIGLGLSFFVYSYRLYKECKGVKIDLSLLRPKRNFLMHSYVTDLAGILPGSIDKIIISYLFGFMILGNYQLGIQFLSLLLLVPSVVYQYILPQDASGTSNRKLKIILVGASGIITLFGILLAPIVIPVFFPKFIETIQVVQIISLVLIPHSFIIILQSQFLGQLKSNIVLAGNGVFVLSQISLIVLLGQVLGINGIALGMVLSSISHALFYIITHKIIQKRMEKNNNK
jgi:O-antigen/teichoic acid export membrane protein